MCGGAGGGRGVAVKNATVQTLIVNGGGGESAWRHVASFHLLMGFQSETYNDLEL